MAAPHAGAVHVAVGVVTDSAGRFLIAQRPAGAHQGGLWEFPGGKVEPGESVRAALERELAEELDIRVLAAEPFIRVPHDYGDRRVYLEVWRVTAYSGEPRGLEGQPLRWIPPGQLHDCAFPAANRPIVSALALPRTCLVTPVVADTDAFLSHLDRALDAGIRFVQLRRGDLDADAYASLAEAVARRCRAAGALLAVNAPPATALRLGAGACHLRSRSAREWLGTGRPVPASVWLGVSCHSPGEIRTALEIGADYLFLSPVHRTSSHPDADPLGWERFGTWAADVPVPVYALGGVGPADLQAALDHGAHGVAGISAFWPALP